MKCLIFIIGLILIIAFFKYREYKRLKSLAYGYKYGIEEYKKYINYLKDKNEENKQAYLNYKNLKKEEIKILNEERIIDLLYISEYGKKEYELYKKYKTNQLSNISSEQIELIRKKEQEMIEAKQYNNLSRDELTHLDMMYGPVEKNNLVEKSNNEEKRKFQPILLIPIVCFIVSIIAAILMLFYK